MDYLIIGLILILILLSTFVILGIVEYNKLIKLLKRVEQSRGSIDVYLKQRFDLIPNLVEVTKSYSKYEKEVLESIVKLRKSYEENKNADIDISAKLNNEYNKLLVTIEGYPELKANEVFLKLQGQLIKIESQLQAARRIYNSSVTEYNIKVNTIPSNLIAKRYKFKEQKLFEITNYEEDSIEVKI